MRQTLKLNNTFELKNIFFKHNDNLENLFENADIKFNVNHMYGIQGGVWNRKTSIVDVITDLLPATGNMYIDGNKINLFEK